MSFTQEQLDLMKRCLRYAAKDAFPEPDYPLGVIRTRIEDSEAELLEDGLKQIFADRELALLVRVVIYCSRDMVFIDENDIPGYHLDDIAALLEENTRLLSFT